MLTTRSAYGRAGRSLLVPLVVATLLLAVLPALAAPGDANPLSSGLAVEVVSSAAHQVTGGDARLEIHLPDQIKPKQVRVLVAGVDQSDRFVEKPGGGMTGVVDGLELGDNLVVVKATGQGRGTAVPRSAELTLVNHPITGSVFSGPQQYPFVCTTEQNGLGQPLVDNDHEGFPVFALDPAGNKTDEIIGYSRDCSAETLVTYLYRTTGGYLAPYVPGQERPADMAETTTLDGATVDYVVRWERGTINRFVYSVAMLAPFDETADDLDAAAWNGRLVYYFQGGVGIGHYQGTTSTSRMLYDDALGLGYGVIYSTGTKTGTHYNLQLGGETALMVKERFIELYGVPMYTVGVGGSGGAIQQYVYAQNHPGLIDAAVPQYAYPDMITQAIHVGDCELLEFYMDVIDAGNPKWQAWSNRRWLEGMNASDTFPNPYTGGLPGSTECINGWRGLSPLVLNPLYGRASGQELIEPPEAVAAIHWTHWADLVNIYGVADDGYARNAWDNVGVQYGLQALVEGNITPEEFLVLNAQVGGWKNEPDMVQEGCPFFPPGCTDLSRWDPWSVRNQLKSPDGVTPASRTTGDLLAMHAAYESGLVFMGDIDIPVIDWRHYLEDFLDMHNSHQSFAARQRMLDADGDASNQVVWFTGAPGGPQFDQTPEAFAVIDEWMRNIFAHPELGVAGNRPSDAVDRCFDAQGNEIASGDGVWAGILDDGPAGACTQQYPVYSTSRIVAGGPLKGGVFKCALQSVQEAIDGGLYGWWSPSPAQQAQLEAIFPDGVCDYSRPDAGLPPGW